MSSRYFTSNTFNNCHIKMLQLPLPFVPMIDIQRVIYVVVKGVETWRVTLTLLWSTNTIRIELGCKSYCVD
ncbi:predicted protein [Sclerotinia sclerotiorum 1980 UF-70]|uniref:Uncharacterized protein n=1 Tax=Sclerotinia sclerotiorum (strain ATCC 18683 / 1980 / Ss-1) TaxID=665079 RepID=A7EYH9_SCLS1|nr:predicted protein [Sclerotinia sclerotiorum 1980 UF-70]EDN94521.1 predicted protein [Sclerotinia sclerotiorum 1980 UF-70]